MCMHMNRPCFKLNVALYGHPQAASFWEQHCKCGLEKAGFEPMHDWENTYVHVELGLYLSVYVDDFKLSGIAVNITQGWKLISEYIA